MKKRKLVLALMLSLMMLVTMIPSFILADETGGAASGAAAGLVLEALLGVELLLRSGEYELLAALAASKSLVFKHGKKPPKYSMPYRCLPELNA